MIPHNPLTPPPDTVDDIVHSSIPSPPLNNSLFATPTSNTGNLVSLLHAGFDSEEPSDGEVEDDDHDTSDEDMEDGGAALTASNIQAFNFTIAGVETEDIAAEDIMSLLYPAQHPPSTATAHNFSFPNTLHTTPNMPVLSHSLADASGDESDASSSASETVGEVVQQLQQLQEIQMQQLQAAQEHAAFQDAPPLGQHTIMNNSIAPIYFPPLLNPLAMSLSSPLPSVAMEQVAAAASMPVAATPSQNAPHLWPTAGATPSPAFDFASQLGELLETLPQWVVNDTDNHEVEDNHNLGLGEFLTDWARGSALGPSMNNKRARSGPSMTEVEAQRWPDLLACVRKKDLQGERCDFQRVNWQKLGVTRAEAKQRRRSTYRNYTNLRIAPKWHPRLHGAVLSDEEDYFRFRRMDFEHEIHLSHFQLRNLLSCASRDHLFYAGRSEVIQVNPTTNRQQVKGTVMDLSNPTVSPFHGSGGAVQISTLAVGHDILVTGGFAGEYALLNLKAQNGTKHTEGIVTNHINNITNHVQVHLSRTSASPRVAIASNDNGMRVLDVATNKFVADHAYDHAINCTAISPDQRLRVLVGDSRQVMICNAETGEILQSLEGHRDFGFACDWSDDGWTVATGNQDMQIKIWDARKWTSSQGVACPVTTIAAEMAGVRKLKFSPLGSGQRVLVAAEPADYISVIDAVNFQSKQLLSFFGEVGGFDFTNGGRDIMVGNCDVMRGGIMQFERCGMTSNIGYDLDDMLDNRNHKRLRGGGYEDDWSPTRSGSETQSSLQYMNSGSSKANFLGSQVGDIFDF